MGFPPFFVHFPMEREKTIYSLKSTQTVSHIFFLLLCCWNLIEWQMTFLRSMPRRDFFFWRIESCFPLKATEWGSQLYSLCVETKSPLNFFIIFLAKMSLPQQQIYLGRHMVLSPLRQTKKSTWTHRHFFSSIFFQKALLKCSSSSFAFVVVTRLGCLLLLLLLLSSYLKLSAQHTPRLGIKGLLAESEAQSLEQKRAPKNNISKLW